MMRSAVDQAQGLRRKVNFSGRPLGIRVGERQSLLCPPPALIVHWEVGRVARLQNARLIWHWQELAPGAFGWDMQARLHVWGTAPQFPACLLSQWRYLFPQWHLRTQVVAPLPFADYLYLYLHPQEVISAYTALKSVCESLKGVPIIILGAPSRFTECFALAVRAGLGLRVGTKEREDQQALVKPLNGYYRLITHCH